MQKDRSTLLAEIETILADNSTNDVTVGQLRGILQDVVDSTILVVVEYTDPTEIDSLNIRTPSAGITMDGTKVLGARGAAITAPGTGEPVLSEVAAAVNEIINRMVDHGLIAPES